MNLATASIAAITASISRIDSEIDTNAANITLATASIAAITASLGQPVNTDSNVTFNNINSTGTITAVEVHTTFVSSSIAVISGSNTFGDDTSDSHQFTGSLSVSSSLSVIGSGTITGTLGVNGSPGEANSKFAVDGNIEMLSGSNRLFIPRASDGALTTSIYSRTGNNLTLSGAGSSTGQIEFIPSSANSSRVVMLINKDSRISLSNNDAGTSNTIFGKSAGDAIASGGNYNVVIGEESGTAITTGDGNVAVGFEALATEDTRGTSTAIGYRALKTQNADQDAVYNTAVGYDAGVAITTGNRNTLVGGLAGVAINTADGNTYIGYAAGDSATNGEINVGIGMDALGSSTSVGSCVAIGYQAMNADATADADGSVAIGTSALTALTTGAGNVAIGYQAGDAMTTSALNTLIGYQAGSALNRAGNQMSTIIGYQAADVLTGGSSNIVIGARAFGVADNDESFNVIIGTDAGNAINHDDADSNVIIGQDAGIGGAAAMAKCVAVGGNAMNSTAANAQTGTIAIGYDALTALTSGTGNIAIGHASQQSQTDGERNVSFGYGTLSDADSGESDNIAIGYYALNNLNSGSATKNIAIGAYAADGMGTIGGLDNTFIGYGAGGGTWATAASSNNVSLGNHTLNGAMNNASNNTAIGYGAGNTVATGDSNVFVGYLSCDGVTSGYQNVCIGSDVSAANEATSVNQIVIGYGAAGVANNTAIIGNSSVTDVYMGDNGNAWSQTSDGRLKENVKEWNKGLDEINKLRVVEFNFKKDNPFDYNSDKKRQGIIAQEAQEVLPEMVKDDSEWLSANTEPMVWALVRAVQELSEKIKHIEKTCKCMKEE
jgi:hypothetical protein